MRWIVILAVVVSSTPAFAQTAPARGWIDIDFIGAQSMQGEDTVTFTTPLFGETATAAASYPKLGRALGGGVSGGFAAGPVGFGVRWLRTRYDQTVGLAVRIPHPTLFGRHGSDVDITEDPMSRHESSVDLSAVYIAPTSDAWRIRLFGGPTYFSVSEDMVEIIRYSQVFNIFTGLNAIDITTYAPLEVDGSTWGFHGGADVAYFFSRYVGVGGGFRVNKGTVQIEPEPLTHDSVDLSVGHATFGGGLRLRF